MKKLLLSLLAVVGLAGIGKMVYSQVAVPAATPVTDAGPSTGDATATPAGSAVSTATDMPTSTPAASSSGLKDGTYTGSSESNEFGTVQVAAVISGGKITNVKFLQMPGGDGHTNEVTSIAKPELLQETLQAQSANVDLVTGATTTSESFIRSLRNALGQAGA